ncbi:MAG: Rid family detoxifying hydrolase [Candidatus Saccharimonadales bacterium]|nr:Rid family detoxifying hydrolase [Candidatus Saccharimonadales bacterium]
MGERVRTDKASGADGILSQAMVSNGLVFCSGQVHMTDGKMVEGSVKDKMDAIMANISAVLEAAGSSLDKAVDVKIFVTDMGQMGELNEVYPSYFKGDLPARAAIGVNELPLGAAIEISLIAEK